MFIREITFNIAKTTPLFPLTNNQDHQYANVKPGASVTVAFGETECDPTTEAGQSLLAQAFDMAEEACFGQMQRFNEHFMDALGTQ